MSCLVGHDLHHVPGADAGIPELHGLSMPRDLRGPIENLTFESKILSSIRMLRVYTPAPGFVRDSEIPVILVNDGHKAFEPSLHRSPHLPPWQHNGTLQLHRIMDGLACEQRTPACAVVAIPTRASSRANEFVPHETELNGLRFGGLGNQYLDFLEHEVLPLIHQQFPHLPLSRKPESRILLGSSLGGFAALYGAIKRPECFGAAIAISPSAWVDNGFLSRFVRENGHHKPRIATDIGHAEAPLNKDHCGQLYQSLRDSGWEEGINLSTSFVEGSHDEDSWRQRLPRLLEFVLGQWAG